MATIADVRSVLPLAAKVFNGATHCCAHVILDDPNYGDDTAAFCLKEARDQRTPPHPDCVVLCEALVNLSQTQRRKLSRLSWALAHV